MSIIFVFSNSLRVTHVSLPFLLSLFSVAVGEAALGLGLLLSYTRRHEKAILINYIYRLTKLKTFKVLEINSIRIIFYFQ